MDNLSQAVENEGSAIETVAGDNVVAASASSKIIRPQ